MGRPIGRSTHSTSVTLSLSSDSCKAQDIYRKRYLFISTTKSYCSSKARPISKTSAHLSLAVKEDGETCLTVTRELAVTEVVKTFKISFADDLSTPSANKETKQSCEFHFLWFMKAATVEQQGFTLLGQPSCKNNGEEMEPPPSAIQKARRLKELQM